MAVSNQARDATRARILKAATDLLGEEGFQGLGINAVARAAGCDKVLIYRYFWGLEGLAEAMGGQLDLWIGQGDPAPGDYVETLRSMLLDYGRALRGNSLVRRILAWELLETSPLARALGEAKSAATRAWFQAVRSRTGPAPDGVDAPAINAILIAATHHLALREDNDGTFAGLDLKQPETWARIDAAMTHLMTRAYGKAPL